MWDTVGALGVPLARIPGISSKTLVFHHTGLRIPLKHAFHALAIDDHRLKFAPTLWTVNTKKKDGTNHLKVRPIEDAEQRWFVGAHANVGGGCMSDTLAQRPLEWMISKAQLHGLDFDGDLNVDKGVITPISDSYREFLWGIYRGFSWRHYRPIGAGSYVDERGTQTYVNETIDVSVFDRWRNDPTYRPVNLENWAKRYKAKPAEIQNSVFATEPERAAPE